MDETTILLDKATHWHRCDYSFDVNVAPDIIDFQNRFLWGSILSDGSTPHSMLDLQTWLLIKFERQMQFWYYCPIKELSIALVLEVNGWITESVTESASPYASQIVLAKKKMAVLIRVCVDYRILKRKAIKDAFSYGKNWGIHSGTQESEIFQQFEHGARLYFK